MSSVVLRTRKMAEQWVWSAVTLTQSTREFHTQLWRAMTPVILEDQCLGPSEDIERVDRAALMRELRAAVSGDDVDIDLAGTALLLAALDHPGVDLASYRQHLDTLAADLGAATSTGGHLLERIDALRAVVFNMHGYAGDTESYDDLKNANLISVIDRRRGIPVSLGIICLHGLRAQGWEAAGVNFPAHFLIQLKAAGEVAILDPFDHVQQLHDAELRQRLQKLAQGSEEPAVGDYGSVGNRDILLRLQNNIRIRAQQKGDIDTAIGVVESMSVLANDAPAFRLEIATLKAKVGELKSALRDVEAVLNEPGAQDLHQQAKLLQTTLKGRLN